MKDMDDRKKPAVDSAGKAEQELLELEEILDNPPVSERENAREEGDASESGTEPHPEIELYELEEDAFEPTSSRILDFDFSDMDELHRRAARSQTSEPQEHQDAPEKDFGPAPGAGDTDAPLDPTSPYPSAESGPGPETQGEYGPDPELELEPERDPEFDSESGFAPVIAPDVPPGSSETGDPAGHVACDPLPRYNDFIFQDLHGRFLFSGASVHPLEQGDPVSGYCQLVADFYGSPGPGVLIVEGVHKYAPVLGRRKLQQQGEITDEFVLRPMQSLKIGKNETSLFYHLVPRAEQGVLFKESENSPEGFLLHDTVTMLHGLLQNMKQEGPVGLALHLPEAVLLVAGDRKRVVWARRYTLAGDDMSALREGFEIIAQDLHNVRRDSGVHIREVLWIESLVRELQWPEFASEEFLFTRMPVFALQGEDEPLFSALPGIMGRVGSGTALTEPAERILVGVGRWEKVLLSLLLVVSFMVGGAGFWLASSSVELDARKQELTHLKQRLTREYATASDAIGFLKKDSAFAAEAGQVADQVGRAGKSSPLAGIWNALARLRPKPCRVQALEVTYEPELARIRMEGVLDLGLTEAQAAYSGFLTVLEEAGFTIRQQSFQLDVDSNFFSLVLEKRFSE